jgi:hypothetical protein
VVLARDAAMAERRRQRDAHHRRQVWTHDPNTGRHSQVRSDRVQGGICQHNSLPHSACLQGTCHAGTLHRRSVRTLLVS